MNLVLQVLLGPFHEAVQVLDLAQKLFTGSRVGQGVLPQECGRLSGLGGLLRLRHLLLQGFVLLGQRLLLRGELPEALDGGCIQALCEFGRLLLTQ